MLTQSHMGITNPKKFPLKKSFRVTNFGEARVFIASTTLNFNKKEKKKNQYDLVKIIRCQFCNNLPYDTF